MSNDISDINRRVYDLENRTALIEQSKTHLEEKFTTKISEVQSEIKDIKQGINRVLWALAFVVISYIGQFILSGGLNVSS